MMFEEIRDVSEQKKTADAPEQQTVALRMDRTPSPGKASLKPNLPSPFHLASSRPTVPNELQAPRPPGPRPRADVANAGTEWQAVSILGPRLHVLGVSDAYHPHPPRPFLCQRTDKEIAPQRIVNGATSP
jgi:hypothetical protein